MEPERLEIEGTWEEIAAQASRFIGRRVRLTVLSEAPDSTHKRRDTRTLEEKIAEIAAQVPEEEWSKLPADLGDQLDHYIYGTPKRE
jgi:hypothetical protein